VFCAFGGLVSDLVHDVVRTVHGRRMSSTQLGAVYSELDAEAEKWLRDQVSPGILLASELQYFAEMRYSGQSFQVDVPLPGEVVRAFDLSGAEEAFHAEHERLYSYRSHAAVEFVSLRTRVLGQLQTPEAVAAQRIGGDAASALLATREVRFQNRTYPETPVYKRDRLSPGTRLAGLAFIEQGDATVLVPPHFVAEVGPFGDIILQKDG
jgi:N-methylhydantoinase A